jgi:hypothetical protein
MKLDLEDGSGEEDNSSAKGLLSCLKLSDTTSRW